MPVAALEPVLCRATLARQFATRVAVRWPFKMAWNIAGMAAFFFVYFWVQHHPLQQPVAMPLTTIDDWIGFWPGAIFPYVSLFLYVSLPFALFTQKHEFSSFGLAAFVLSVVGLTIFLIWPTAVPSGDVSWARHPRIGLLAGVDGTGNACPSLHVAFAIFAAVWLDRLLTEMRAGGATRIGNWLWCAAILYSTMAVRQHVFVDVVFGAVLGSVVAIANMAWLRRVQRS